MAKPKFLFLYPGVGRKRRLAALASGEAPRDFFYGYLALSAAGYDCRIGDTRREPAGIAARLALVLEKLRNRTLVFGLTRQRVRALESEFANCDIALSFTDAFSLSMGYWRNRAKSPYLAGGFHGLADLHTRTPFWARAAIQRSIARAVRGLDHLFFFGEADRLKSIEMYAIAPERTSLFQFGIDDAFWTPDPEAPEQLVVFAVGSDPQRDYETLVGAPTDAPLRLLTSLRIAVPPGRDVELLRGNLYGSPVSDVELRDMYRQAAIVAVPLLDVYQPSGYSVTLQAMACGRPVVLSRNRGLWDPEMFRSGENCILVPPGDRKALAQAIDTLMADAALRLRIGRAARETVERHFALSRMDAAIVALADRLRAEAADVAPEAAR